MIAVQGQARVACRTDARRRAVEGMRRAGERSGCAAGPTPVTRLQVTLRQPAILALECGLGA